MAKTNYADFTTENLLRLFQEEKDEQAFDQLLKNYYHLIFGACLKFSRNRENAKDLSIEVCTILWEKAQVQEINNFNSWLYTVCNNHCLEFYRNKQRSIESKIEYKSIEELEEIPNLVKEEPVIVAEATQPDIKEIERTFDLLPQEQRVCMKMFYLKKLSYARIQNKTGFSLKKIKSSLQNGRKSLRKSLNY